MIEPVKLLRPQRRQLAEQGVDFLKMISQITQGKRGPNGEPIGEEDVTIQDIIEVIDLKQVDLIVDVAYPDKKAELDDMPEMDLIQLAIKTYMKSFSGAEVAGKS